MSYINSLNGIGSWITIGHHSIAEIMSNADFDWLCVDMEHTVINLSQLQNVVSIIQGKRKIALVRAPENNPAVIKKILDIGPDGIIIPMINNRTEAKTAVSAVRYPPDGTRGVGLARAQGYGFEFDEYLKKEKKLKIILQIEHIDAIKNLRSILSVKGLSGTIIGPYDLSSSMGKPGKFDDLEVQNALFEYEKISKKKGVPMGYHIVNPDSKELLIRKNRGYEILALSFDAMFLGSIVRERLNDIKTKI